MRCIYALQSLHALHLCSTESACAAFMLYITDKRRRICDPKPSMSFQKYLCSAVPEVAMFMLEHHMRSTDM